MTRRLFTLAAALSMLLCLTTLSLWVPSYRRGEMLLFSRRASNGEAITCGLGSQSGAMVLIVARVSGVGTPEPFSRWELFETNQSAVVPRNVWERIGFARLHQDVPVGPGASFSVRAIGVPHWLVAGSFAALPLGWLRRALKRRRARHRRAAGQCLECGYNLTGNTSGTCPECGAVVPLRR